MNNNETYLDIYLCSFASSDLRKSRLRFEDQAKEMKIYKDVKIFI